jgi:hypothetical protein
VPIVEPNLLVPVPNFDPLRGALQGKIVGRHLDAIGEYPEVLRRCAIAGALREIPFPRNAQEVVAGAIATDVFALGISSHPDSGRHRVHQRRQLVGTSASKGFTLPQRRLGRLQRRQVGRDIHQTLLTPEINPSAVDTQSERAPVFGPVAHISVPRRLLQGRDEGGRWLRRPHAEFHRASADSLLARETGHCDECVVDVQVGAVGEPRDGDRLRIDLEDCLESSLGRTERFFRLPPIVHVERRSHPTRNDAFPIQDGLHATEVPPVLASAGSNAILHLGW